MSNLSFVVVDTGQEECYSNSDMIDCPKANESFFAQDAHHEGNRHSFRDNNNDGTVTDLNTGLMWAKDPGDKVTWEEAQSGAAAFNLADYNDWRLPTIKELYSLIDFRGETGTSVENAIPYIDTNYFVFTYGDTSAEDLSIDNDDDTTVGKRYIDAQYWSATEYVGTTMMGDHTVFGVNFADGRIKGYPSLFPPYGTENTMFAMYVRGNTSYGVNNFVDNNDGTVTDQATGLMWQQDDSGYEYSWEDALAWCADLSLEDHDDWRLPNAKELQSIVDYTRAPAVTYSAAIDDSIFEITEMESFFWTSTTHLDPLMSIDNPQLGSNAVYISFGRALGYIEMPPKSGNYQLLDVHGAGAQRSDPKLGDPDDYPNGHGPQGDVIRIFNYVRCVRDAN